MVIVDYAHTPDGLKNVLDTAIRLRSSKGLKKIICVFGCGGDRDTTKRPQMAKIVEDASDIIIVTSDNPRTEDPEKILNDIEFGFANKNNSSESSKEYFRIADRKSAIDKALQVAGRGDIVLIVGKGHEDYQIIGKEKIHFSDKEIVEGFYL